MKSPIWIKRVTPRGTRTHKSVWTCHCGSEFVASDNNVNRGHTKSCGCSKTEASMVSRPRHGHAHHIGEKPSPTYIAWVGMVARCCNPNNSKYHLYGGAGVRVYWPWRDKFENFLASMGERPDGLTLDRYPNPFGHYEPNNCRWATAVEQRRNRRDCFAKFDPARAKDYNKPYLR